MKELREGESRLFWIVVLALFLLTRIPAMSQYLSIDNVNLAFSLEKFDPRAHQPQPPGYPLFVVFNRIVNVVFHDAETTFALTGLLVSALSLFLVCAVGSRMFSRWVGRTAALMLLVAPPFWYASLEGPLRPHLALFSLLIAYCCWRCWNGEKAFAIWGAIALGVGAGFRPDLGVYLFPLWLLSAWMGTRSLAGVMKGLAVMAGVVLTWVGGMAYVVGGFRELYSLNVDYVAFQSTGQTVSRQLSRLVVWNGSAILGALFAIPLFFREKDRLGALSAQSVFMLAWLLPGLLFQGFIHIEDTGHTLFSVPALCIAGAYVIFAATEKWIHLRDTFVAVSLIVSSILFLGLFALPAAGAPAGGWHSVKNAFLFGTFETSIGELRYLDNTAVQTMAEFREFAREDMPTIIVSSDTDSLTWFTNWRIVRYYMPNMDIWVLGELKTPHFVQHARRDRLLEATTGPNLKVPLPRGGRVIWLTEREGSLHQALKKTFPALPGGAYLSYTDVTPDMQPFQLMGIDFVPAEQ